MEDASLNLITKLTILQDPFMANLQRYKIFDVKKNIPVDTVVLNGNQY